MAVSAERLADDRRGVMELKLELDELKAFVAEKFPQMAAEFDIRSVGPMCAQVAMMPDHGHLRPGATVSGPTIFALADCAVYYAVLAMIGREALAVTTNGSIDFMRKAVAGHPLVADVRLLKVGRVLAVGDVAVRTDGMDEMVARATLTYSIPPR